MSGGLVRAWFRMFLVQGSWNYDRMVGLGVGYAMEPTLRTLPGGVSGKRYADAMRRAGSFFNAHPYMAAVAVGAEARAEHDGVPPDQIRRLRGALVGPLGSIGDKLIWAGVLPCTIGIGLIGAASMSPLVGVVIFLTLYNAVHLIVRGWALRAGWQSGTRVARALTSVGIQRGLQIAGPLASVAIGVSLPLVAEWLTRDLTTTARLNVGVVAVLGIVLLRWIVPTLGGLRLGGAAVVVALAVGWLWP